MYTAVVRVDEYDMDFGIFNVETKEMVPENQILTAEGETPELAWAELIKHYKIGAWHQYPAPTHSGYDKVRVFAKLFEEEIVEVIAADEYPDAWFPYHGKDEDGCFLISFSGNQEFDIEMVKGSYQPVTAHPLVPVKDCFVVMHHEGGDEIHMVLFDAKHLPLFDAALDEENREGNFIKASYKEKLDLVYYGDQCGEPDKFFPDNPLAKMEPAAAEDKPYESFIIQSHCIEEWPFDPEKYKILKTMYMPEWGC